MSDDFAVSVAAGSLRANLSAAATLPHKWTEEGVAIDLQFTGAHLLHLAAAGCVLNDVYREAATAEIDIDGVLVTAAGDFDTDTWQSTGITYQVRIDSGADAEAIAALIRTVDDVAEIPKALRAGAHIQRTE